MSISTAIIDLLEAKADLDKIPGGNENESWYESALETVGDCEKALDDVVDQRIDIIVGLVLRRLK